MRKVQTYLQAISTARTIASMRRRPSLEDIATPALGSLLRAGHREAQTNACRLAALGRQKFAVRVDLSQKCLVACNRIAAERAPSVSSGETDECRDSEKRLELEDSHGGSLMSVGSKKVDGCRKIEIRETGEKMRDGRQKKRGPTMLLLWGTEKAIVESAGEGVCVGDFLVFGLVVCRPQKVSI
jgi:hypothetical protein